MTSKVLRDVYIVSTARTPFGSFKGKLAAVTGPRLASLAIAEALKRAGIEAGVVEGVYLGCSMAAGTPL